MKILKEHQEVIKTAIDSFLASYGKKEYIAKYEVGNFPQSAKVKDLQKRFCFDLFYVCVLSKWVIDNIYPYANDNHIYTVLKQVCPKVTRRY